MRLNFWLFCATSAVNVSRAACGVIAVIKCTSPNSVSFLRFLRSLRRVADERLGIELPPVVSERRCMRASPRYARALIDNIEHDPSLRFAAVWQGPKLIALLPFTS